MLQFTNHSFKNLAIAISLLALGICPAQADTVVPQTQSQITFSFAPVVKKAAPAVVNIYAKSRVQVTENVSPFANDPFFSQFFGNNPALGGLTHEQIVSSLGSGVIIKPDGLIVTSFHVIKGAQEIRVVLADKRELDAKVVVRDPQSDLAFLKINAPAPLPYLEMRDSDTLEVGDLVLAIGDPFGVGQTVTSGIVSALARKAAGVSDYQYFIQTDAAINPGNSGGALVDMDGRLIGINTAIYSRSGGSIGIGFAIPANMVRSLMAGKVEDGRVVRPWLGITVQPVTPQIAESQGMKTPQGVLIVKMSADSSAAKSGLKPGDIIIGLDGAPIGSEQDLFYRMALAKIGDTAKFRILRNGHEEEINVMLMAPAERPLDEITIKGHNPMIGVTVANLSPALAASLNLAGDIDAHGVVVTKGNSGGLALSVSFQPGDVILKINGTSVDSTAELQKLLSASQHKWAIVYQRGGNTLTLTVQM